MLKILSDSSPSIDFKKFDKLNQERMRGANEDDIIFGGLEDIMSNSSKVIADVALKNNMTLRIAAYYNALNKIHNHY